MGTMPTSPGRTVARSLHAAAARVCAGLAVGFALGLAMPGLSHLLAGHYSRLAWTVDLATHFQLFYALGMALCALIAATRRRRWLAMLLLLPLPWLTASARLESAPEAGATFVVAAANVHVSTRDAAPYARWFAQVQPDLIVLTEVSPAFATALAAWTEYPYREISAAEHAFGMAVLSRHPMQATLTRDADRVARLDARLEVGPTCFDLVALHPVPPASPRFHAARDTVLHTIAANRNADAAPLLVVGDLNATPWSSAFSGLARAGLRRAGRLQPTWPSAGRGVLGIPIDHVLASEGWRVRAADVGPDLGSDHLPVQVHLATPATKCGN